MINFNESTSSTDYSTPTKAKKVSSHSELNKNKKTNLDLKYKISFFVLRNNQFFIQVIIQKYIIYTFTNKSPFGDKYILPLLNQRRIKVKVR